MSELLFTGGTVVTAEGSYRADVLVEDGKISAVGASISSDGLQTVDASGLLVMPGFIDAHTHMDMPFGGTMTADDWATGTEAAAAGGTTTIIDFALQEVGGTLAGAVEAWTEKARDKAVIDYGFHVAITDLRDDIKAELPDLAARGVASVKIFMAYKGTPLYTEDDDLFETLQLSGEAGVLVMVHAENGDAIAKLQQQALARGETGPKFHALTRPEAVEAEATNRAIRLAEVAEAPSSSFTSRARRRSRPYTSPTSAARRSTPRPVPSTSPSSTRTSREKASRAPSTCARLLYATPLTARRSGTGSRRGTSRSSAPTTAPSTLWGRRTSAATTSP